MKNDIYLMLKDYPVMRINLDEAAFDVIDAGKMPYQLKNRFKEIDLSNNTAGNVRKNAVAMAKNIETFTNYLAQRVLPITKENAKKIYALFGYEQLQDDYSKSRIAITCKAISLQDNYWLKSEQNKNLTWKDVDLRQHKLNEIVAQVALHGTSLTLTGDPTTPELTAQGAYAKAWKREDDGLYLLKKSAKNSNESEIEVMTSNILDKCNVEHVIYMPETNNGKYCSKCKCMTTDDLSILPAMDFESYCNRENLNFLAEVKKIDESNFYKMCVVDYLIANRDRHGMNWGFYYNSDTLKIQGLHPLFDHNNAFDEEYMKNKDAKYLAVPSMTTREAAMYAIKRVDFHFTEQILPTDFLTKEQYDMFMDRARELNIQVKHSKTITANTKSDLEAEIIEQLQTKMKYSEKTAKAIVNQMKSNLHKPLNSASQEELKQSMTKAINARKKTVEHDDR